MKAFGSSQLLEEVGFVEGPNRPAAEDIWSQKDSHGLARDILALWHLK